MPRLIRDGRFTRPALGISAGAGNLQRALNLPKGVVIVQTSPSGPAAKAGLQPFRRGQRGEVIGGDVITAINDDAVADMDDLLSQLERRTAGDTVTLTVWRGGQTRKVSVQVAAGD